MMDLADIEGYEFFRPLTTGWLAKVESALTSHGRKKWKEVADESMMFYSRSAAAMWDPLYTKKFWKGVKAPRFRISINKAFEYVAVFLPNLLWDIPHRTATSKKLLEVPQELFPDQQVYQAIMQSSSQETVIDKLVGHLMEGWLNYTPREQPDGGLAGHNELAVLDAMLKGSGVLWPAPYSHPSSDMTLTGCFREPPEDLIFDPDFATAGKCKWIAKKHVEAHWQVERKFSLKPNSLKGKATLESSWHYSEGMTREGQSSGERKSGKTNDLVVWYEIWSKLGVGARMTGMPDMIKTPLEQTVGDYAYLAICPDCPYPLNCTSEFIRNGATPEQVRECFEWPVPLWGDSRWPFESLQFHIDPDSPYGIPPLAPALGELKAINAIVSWLVNRTWQSSRQMWAVLGQYHDDLKKQLDDGEDMSVFAIPPGSTDDIKKIIQLVEQKEVNKDAWSVLEMLSNTFDKRMGMTPFVYGMNENGTQDRTAETTNARKQAVGVRPEYMQKKVVEWQSRVAGVEAMLTWMFVKAKDVQPLLGNAGAMLWQQHIENADHELVMRQMRYEVAASSIRRPNRDRDIDSLNELLGRFLPEASKHAELTGDWEPINGAMKRWGDLHDMEVDALLFQPQNPEDPKVQLQQRQQEAEISKTEAEAQKLQAEAQANPMAELQMEQQANERDAALEIEKTKAQLEMDLVRLQEEIEAKKTELSIKIQEGQLKLQQQQQQNAVDLSVSKEIGAQKVAQGNLQLKQQQEAHQQNMTATKEQSSAKTHAIKQQAAAKASAKPRKAS